MRPVLIALACLLGGFTGFQHLGVFRRLHLARLVFGRPAVDTAVSEVTTVLNGWGYRTQARDGEGRLPGVLAQALLVNGSPRLPGPDHRVVRPAARPSGRPAAGEPCSVIAVESRDTSRASPLSVP